MRKRIMSLAMAVMMVFSLFPFTAAAAEADSGACGENVTWSLEEDGVLTVSGEGPMKDYVSTDQSPFYHSADVREINIAPGVTTIGNHVFEGCANLERVSIPNTVTSIGVSAFEGCSSLPSVSIPGSVTVIKTDAFEQCSALTSVTIPGSVSSLWDSVFAHCTGLTSVTVGAGVTSIADSMFWGCSSMTRISIPASVTSIGNWAFNNCTSLQDVYYSGSCEQWEAVSVSASGNGDFQNAAKHIASHAWGDWVVVTPATLEAAGERMRTCSACGETVTETIPALRIIGSGSCGEHVNWRYTSDNTLTFYGTGEMRDYAWTQESERPWSVYKNSVRSVVVEEGVTSVGGNACYWFSNIQSISLASTVESIGSFAFKFSAIRTLDLPEKLTSIGDGAFADCHNLGAVVIPEGVKTIGHDAFVNGYALRSVTFPSTLEKIDYYAFANCVQLTSLVIPGSVQFIGDHAFKECTGLTSLELQPGVSGIDQAAFPGCTGLTSVTIPDSVTVIPDYLFNDCTALESVSIPGSVKSIGNQAFSRCTALQSIALPEGVETIGTYAFTKSGLTAVSLPASLKSIEEYAFDETVKDIYYADTEDQWKAVKKAYVPGLYSATAHFLSESGVCGENVRWDLYTDGLLRITGTGPMYDYFTSSRSPFYENSSVQTVVIEPGVTSIGDEAFYQNDTLTEIRIPDTVHSVGSYAFLKCANLVSAALPDSIDELGIGVFYGCSGLESVVLSHNLVEIPNYLFQSCSSLVSVTIPDTVTRIGDDAFHGCTALADVSIPNDVTSIGSFAFCSCGALTALVLPERLTSVGEYAFYMCGGLGQLVLPNGLTGIPEGMLSQCTNLKSVTIPDSVTSVGAFAFQRCESLENLVIPAGVTEIGDRAFTHCLALTSITIPDGVTRLEYGAFSSCAGLTNVVISEGVAGIGERAFYNCSGLTDVTIPQSVTAIEASAFDECPSLANVWYGGTRSAWDAVEIGDTNDPLLNANLHVTTGIEDSGVCGENLTWTLDSDGLLTISGEGDMTSAPWDLSRVITVVIEPGATSICSDAFHMQGEFNEVLTHVAIPDTVTRIEGGAFYDCKTLETVDIPESVQSIGAFAFIGCKAMTSLVIPEGITRIETDSFSSCHSLRTVELPNTVETIGDYAFYGSESLTEIVLPNSVTDVGTEVFAWSICLTDATLSSGMTSIPNGCFLQCESLQRVTIPKSITSIESSAFSGCAALTDVYYEGTRAEWNAVSISEGNEVLRNAVIHCAPSLGPVILSQPQDASGSLGDVLKFTIEVEGEGITYLWQYSKDGGQNWSLSSSKTAVATCTLKDSSRDGWLYRCIVVDANGNSVMSDSARVIVLTGPTITRQPQDAAGNLGDVLKFTIAAEGEDLTYQWQLSKDGGKTWTNSSSKTAAATCTLVSAARDGWLYRCVVTGANGGKTVSDTARVSLLTGPVITQQPQDAAGNLGDVLKFTIAAEDEDLTYQWQLSKDGGKTWTNSSSKTAAATCTLVSAARDGWLYRCVVTGANGGKTVSEIARVSLLTGPVITRQPQEAFGALGQKVTFTVAAEGEDLTYQWQLSKDGGKTWTNSSSKTAVASCTLVSAARDGWLYRCIITGADGGRTVSGTARVTLVTGFAITQQPQDAAGYLGDVLRFTVVAAGNGLTYQWQFSKDGGNTWNASSSRSASATCTLKSADRDGWLYRCILIDETGSILITNTARVTVLEL